MTRRAASVWALTALAIALGLAIATGGGSATAASTAEGPLADKAILFASDGMRPDLVDKYAAQGDMPEMAGLMADGVKGQNGLLQGFPPNTGVGWYTLATGTWPGEHGSTNNTFHRTGESNFNTRTGLGQSILQADTIQQAAERAGKKTVSVEWVGARAYSPALQGPVVDFRSFFSDRGILLNYDLDGQPAGANAFGVSYQRVDLDPIAGWTNVPASFSPAMEERLKVTNTTFGTFLANVDRFFDLYVYDSTNNGVARLDRVLVVPSTAGKDGNAAVANLGEGDWQDVKVTLTDTRAGQTAGFYLKAIEIGPNFRLYFTSIARGNATYNALGAAGSAAFEETLASRFPSSTAADFAPLEAGIVDEDTYVEQGLMWRDAHFRYLEYIIGTGPVNAVNPVGTINGLGVKPDFLSVGNPVTDEFSHQFMGLVTATDMDGNANPYYDDLTNDNIADGRVAIREGYIRSAYEEADDTLELARELIGGGPTTFVTSDHGFAPQWYAVNVSKALADLGFGPEQSSNCRAVAATLAKECHAGGTAQIYLDLAGRDPTGAPLSGSACPCVNQPQIAAGDYETKRNQIIDYFTNLDDPNLPGQQKVVEAVFKKEQLRNVDGSDSLHPNRSGDVVVVFRPPYQTDAATPGTLIAFSQFFGQHGYLPNLVDLAHNVNMHGSFIAAGPGIRKQGAVANVRAIDLAPTIAFLMGMPGPQNARGKILYGLTAGQGKYKEITLLDISDFHGQLVPMTESADFSSGPFFPIGGSAFLKPWFELYRADATKNNFTVAAGDSVGASPPISSFFGDTPTIEFMNAMGFSADGLGNHNFDKGQAYLRNTLIPLAKFPYVSANVVGANNKTPAEWKPSVTFNVEGGKLGLVGFTNEDAPTLVFPNAFSPFSVKSRVQFVQAEVNALRAKGAKVIVVMGHDGATAGTITAPNEDSPLIQLADALKDVDLVIGDHTNFQVNTTRPNGTLVVENLSKGARFTRVRLVLDPSTGGIVYKTADFHKPWTIGVTPDPAIQARVDELTAILKPLLEVPVGQSTVAIPRSDSCGRSDGRLCESKIGNAIADAIRVREGADFAITNAGGIRADLTCPATDLATDFCPPYALPAPPPFLITKGQVITVLPFGNFVVEATMKGDVLKKLLENAVSSMPSANGRFGQVSGLCFRYDLSLAAGSRVLNAVRHSGSGACNFGAGVPVDLTGSSADYTVAMNDFMAAGGDGYNNQPPAASLYTFGSNGELMEEVVRIYIAANTPISPSIQGRVTCTTSGAAVCPTVVP